MIVALAVGGKCRGVSEQCSELGSGSRACGGSGWSAWPSAAPVLLVLLPPAQGFQCTQAGAVGAWASYSFRSSSAGPAGTPPGCSLGRLLRHLRQGVVCRAPTRALETALSALLLGAES